MLDLFRALTNYIERYGSRPAANGASPHQLHIIRDVTSVVTEQADRGPPAAPEHKYTSGNGSSARFSCQSRARESIPFSSVHWLDRDQIFLRNAGVPEPFIVQMKALVGAMEPIQFYSSFISYSTKDQDFADRLHADLQNRGVRCWFAPHDVRAGRKLREQIDEAIRVFDRLLLMLSDNSMNSEWVKNEIANARQKELNEKRQVLFPISLVPFAKIREWINFDSDTLDSFRRLGPRAESAVEPAAPVGHRRAPARFSAPIQCPKVGMRQAWKLRYPALGAPHSESPFR
jgi:hypothetical protein